MSLSEPHISQLNAHIYLLYIFRMSKSLDYNLVQLHAMCWPFPLQTIYTLFSMSSVGKDSKERHLGGVASERLLYQGWKLWRRPAYLQMQKADEILNSWQCIYYA